MLPNVLSEHRRDGTGDGDRSLAITLVLQSGTRLRAMPELQVVLVELGVAEIEATDATDAGTRVPGYFEEGVATSGPPHLVSPEVVEIERSEITDLLDADTLAPLDEELQSVLPRVDAGIRRISPLTAQIPGHCVPDRECTRVAVPAIRHAVITPAVTPSESVVSIWMMNLVLMIDLN